MNRQPFTYQIRVQGHFGATLRGWFAPLQITNEPSGEATLLGSLRDQAELYGWPPFTSPAASLSMCKPSSPIGPATSVGFPCGLVSS